MLADVPPQFTFADSRIAESSSLVSTQRGDWLWTANDSGDSARLFAVDPAGRTLQVASLPGTTFADLEDVALGPQDTLYLGDIGDNRSERPAVRVFRVPEPEVDPDRRDVARVTAAPQVTTLTYEDGPHNAETLLVHPRTGQVLVVTKGLFDSGVYAAPLPLTDGVLRRVGSLPVRLTGTKSDDAAGSAGQVLTTGGAVSPDGRRVVVRTYTDAYVWDVPGDDLVAALRGTPTVLPLPSTRQGEAVTWTRDGTALLTSSEGRGAPVHRVAVPAPSTQEATPPAPSSPPADAALPADRVKKVPERGRRPLLLAAAGVSVVVVTLGMWRWRR